MYSLSVTGKNLIFYPRASQEVTLFITFSWMIVEDTRLWMRKGIYFSWHSSKQKHHFHVNSPWLSSPKGDIEWPRWYYTYSRNPGLKEPKSFPVPMILPELCPTGRHYLSLPSLFAIQTSLTTKSVPLLVLRDILGGLLPFLPVLQAEAQSQLLKLCLSNMIDTISR